MCSLSNDQRLREQQLGIPIDKPALSDSNYPVLIINLYEYNTGYTYCLYVPGQGILPPSHLIPYCERYILDCIDNEIIPTKLVCKYEERNGIQMIKNGNQVIAEVRDYRRFSKAHCVSNGPVIKQVILKQTTQSVLSDVDIIISKSFSDRQGWKRKRELNIDNGRQHGHADNNRNNNNGSQTQRHTSDTDDEEEERHSKTHDRLTYEQRMEIERQVVNSTAGPLCLDPSPLVGFVANRTQFAKYRWNTKELKSSAKIWANSSQDSQQNGHHEEYDDYDEMEESTEETNEDEEHQPSQLKKTKSPSSVFSSNSLQNGRTSFLPFFNFVLNGKSKLKEFREKEKDVDLFKLPPVFNYREPNPDIPINREDVAKLCETPESAQVRGLPIENSVKKIEEYVLETERRKRPHTTKLSIYQRNGVECYFGELEMESFADPQPKSSINKQAEAPLPNTKCQFELGCSRSVTLYVQQFSDIFTEDGRRPCKITYQKVGQPPKVICTPSYKNNNAQTALTPAPTIAPVVATVNSNVVASNHNQNSTIIKSLTTANGSPITISIPAQSTSPKIQIPATPPSAQHGKATLISSPVSNSIIGLGPSSNTSGVPPQQQQTTVTTTTSQPPVQIVHPQPRPVQRQRQTPSPVTSTHPATAVQVQIQPTQQQQISQIYTVSAGGGNAVAIPTSTMSQSAANVNFNLNSAGIVGLAPQQVLTRPHIFNVNLQQQQQQQQQQNNMRMKQPTLATLLLTGIHPTSGSKPITVAIQPQPQNINLATTSNNTLGSPILSSTLVDQSQQHTIQHQTIQSPMNSFMITSPGAGGATVGHPNSLSVNLNAISLDGQIIAVSSASTAPHGSLQPGTTYHMASSHGVGSMTPISTLNFLRFANNSAQLHRQGNTVSIVNPSGIIISSNGATGTSNVTAATANKPQSTITINDQLRHSQQIEEISVPDLNALLQQQQPQQQQQQQTKNIDGLNLNLNLSALLQQSQQQQQLQPAKNLDGLNLNLNLNLNSNLNFISIQKSDNTSTDSSGQGGKQLQVGNPNQVQGQRQTVVKSEVMDGINVVGVDSFYNSFGGVSPGLTKKLDQGKGQQQQPQLSKVNSIVTSSLPPSKTFIPSHTVGKRTGSSNNANTTSNNSSSMITLNSLLGSPSIAVVSSSTQSPGNVTNSLLSPTSGVSIASSTPRLSALLADTPSNDGISVVDSSTSPSSYGNLLDRLAALSQQQQNQRQQQGGVGRVGSRLHPIATATPNVVLEHVAQQGAGGTSGTGTRQTAYRQIAPAPPQSGPPPHRQYHIGPK